MTVKFSAFALTAALAIPVTACAQIVVDPSPDHVRAGIYQVEPSHTRILFAVSHMGLTTWYGDFSNASGNLTIDPADVAKTTFDITVPVASVSTTNTTLDGELKGAQWLDAGHYPNIEFKSVKVVRTGPDTALVTGDLTLHGVTLPETLKVSFNASGINPISRQYTIGFNATGTIKRSDFGVSRYVPLVGDEVQLTLSAAFVQ